MFSGLSALTNPDNVEGLGMYTKSHRSEIYKRVIIDIIKKRGSRCEIKVPS
jgi:hypothetical protein